MTLLQYYETVGQMELGKGTETEKVVNASSFDCPYGEGAMVTTKVYEDGSIKYTCSKKFLKRFCQFPSCEFL